LLNPFTILTFRGYDFIIIANLIQSVIMSLIFILCNILRNAVNMDVIGIMMLHQRTDLLPRWRTKIVCNTIT
jgi:hydrogenase-4 membrane subunit HyfE